MMIKHYSDGTPRFIYDEEDWIDNMIVQLQPDDYDLEYQYIKYNQDLDGVGTLSFDQKVREQEKIRHMEDFQFKCLLMEFEEQESRFMEFIHNNEDVWGTA